MSEIRARFVTLEWGNRQQEASGDGGAGTADGGRGRERGQRTGAGTGRKSWRGGARLALGRDMFANASRFGRGSAKPWTSVLGLLCLAVITPVLFTAGCSAESECSAWERRCTSTGAIVECTTHPAGTDVSRDPVSASHHSRSPNTWELLDSCGAANLCQTEPVKDSYNVIRQDAFCTLSPTPNPLCAGTNDYALTCDGTTSVECRHGFDIHDKICSSCSAVDGCKGSLNAACTTTKDCASGLECHGTSCQMTCACADGARCTTCDVADRDTVGPMRGKTSVFVCQAGLCASKFL